MVKYSTLDRAFSALSDPTRREILQRLASGPATVSELAHPFDISLPGLLKHVRILEDAQLVITEKQGRTRRCRLGPEQLDDAAQWIATYRRRWEGRLDRLEGYLDRKRERTAVSHDLKLERLYDAAAEVVFDAFTDPQAQKELYADAPDWIVQAECDLRVGGRWTIVFGPPGATPARETNVFEVVDRPRRLVYRSTMTMPDGSSLDTGMEVTVVAEGGRTRLTIVQSGFPTAEARDEFAGGWASILDGLGRAIAARVTGRS
jgi:DNA-binding transcriptional ArsR family regulator/uncharacterized protein YndB with AHSA1/START domain